MQTKWKAKNKESLNEAIKSNENEITRINKYMNSFFTTEAETTKMMSNIHALESENKRLEHLEPSNFSPAEIIALTKSQLPALDGHKKKKQGSIVKISFVDASVASPEKVRHAVWKLVLNEWQYVRYE